MNLSEIKKTKRKVTFSKEQQYYKKNNNQIKSKTIPKIISNKTKKKSIQKKNNSKKFTSFRKKKLKYYKSKKKQNLKNYLIKNKIINKNTKSPDKLVNDLFQICYNNDIKIIKYPQFKYNK